MPPSSLPPTGGTGRRVLLVDDDDTFRSTVAMNLEDHGWQVVEAGGGRAAIDILASDPRFDAVLLDWQMSDLDGLAVHDVVRRDRPGMPVMFLTSAGERLARKADGRIDATPVLDKTVSFSVLEGRLLSAIVHAEGEAPQAAHTGLRGFLRSVQGGSLIVARVAPALDDPSISAAVRQQVTRRLASALDTTHGCVTVGSSGLVMHLATPPARPMALAQHLRHAAGGTVMLNGRRHAVVVGVGLAPVTQPDRAWRACALAARRAARSIFAADRDSAAGPLDRPCIAGRPRST